MPPPPSRSNRQALQVLLVLALLVLAAPTFYWRTRPVLRLYVWDGYFPRSVLTEFELTHRVRISVRTYSTNEELLSRLKVSWDEFDVIMPSNYVVAQLRRFNLLDRMDDVAVPNLRNIDPSELDGRIVPVGDEYYAVPYLWNFAGIGYNRELVPNPPATWADFFNANTARRYGRRLSLLDQPRETIGLALLSLGHSPNSRDPKDLDQVRQILRDQSAAGAPRFVMEEGRDLLLERKTALLSTWSPEVALAEEQSREIGYIMPRDGSILTVDTLAVPNSSSRQALAKEFINFVLQPSIARRVTEYSGYANSLKPELSAVPPNLRSTPSFALPPPGKTYVLTDVGDAQYLYDTIWAEYRSRPRN